MELFYESTHNGNLNILSTDSKVRMTSHLSAAAHYRGGRVKGQCQHFEGPLQKFLALPLPCEEDRA